MNTTSFKPLDFSPLSLEEFTHLGDGLVAYVKSMRADEISRLFPHAPKLEPDVQFFALLSADGSPILLTDSRDSAIANAWENDLETVSVH